MKTTAREAFRKFLEQQVPKQITVLNCEMMPCIPKFPAGFYVVLDDPRGNPFAEKLRDEYRALRAAADQEQSDEAEGR
jgi:hypothetical protein